MRPMHPEKKMDGFVTLGGPLPVPQCPQFRSFVFDRLSPVTGYCDLGKHPRRLMIPSVELYRAHCCSGHFDACPWYRGDAGEDGS
jgi:hypothetical protein